LVWAIYIGGNVAQGHIAGIQTELGRAERDVIGLGTQQ